MIPAFELQQPGRPDPSQSRKLRNPGMVPRVALNLGLASSSQTPLPSSFSQLGNKNPNTKHTLGTKAAVFKSHDLTQHLILFSGSLHAAQTHWLLGSSFKRLTHQLTNGPTVQRLAVQNGKASMGQSGHGHVKEGTGDMESELPYTLRSAGPPDGGV